MRKCTVLSGAILHWILGPNLLQTDIGGGNAIWIVLVIPPSLISQFWVEWYGFQDFLKRRSHFSSN